MLSEHYRRIQTRTIEWVIRRAAWPADEQALRNIRQCVFVEEQRIPAELEWDGWDADCVHVLAVKPDTEAVGTGRLMPQGKLGG